MEELGEGRAKARLGGEVVTVKEKWEELRRRKRDVQVRDQSVPEET